MNEADTCRKNDVPKLQVAGSDKRPHAINEQRTFSHYLKCAERAGLAWPLAAEWHDAALERALLPPPPSVPAETRGLPDFATAHCELKPKGVTLYLLWEEYKAAYPDVFQYSWLCHRYRVFAKKVDLVMGQSHRAGETTFVDYAGQTVGIADPTMGETRQARYSRLPTDTPRSAQNASGVAHTPLPLAPNRPDYAGHGPCNRFISPSSAPLYTTTAGPATSREPSSRNHR